jgi:hypothetical protein
MKEPGTKGSEKPRLKIEVKERLHVRLVVPAEEFKERGAAEMVNHAGGKKYVAGGFRGKGVLLEKLAWQALGGRKAVRFRYQDGVEIHAEQFNVVVGERNIGGQPASGVADATSDIGDAQGIANTGLANRGEDAAKKLPDTMTVIELLGQALHFPVNGEKQRVDSAIVKNTGFFRQGVDRAQCLAIVKSVENFEELLFADGQALVRVRIVLND